MRPTEMEEYLFDLRGYIVLKRAVDAGHLAEINAIVDTYLDVEPDGWRGWVHRDPIDGFRHLHNIFEMGEPCERLIDHPAWIDHLRRFVGGDDGLFIDESFIDIRTQGRRHAHALRRAPSGAFARSSGFTTTSFAAGRSTFCWRSATSVMATERPWRFRARTSRTCCIRRSTIPKAPAAITRSTASKRPFRFQLGAGDALFFVDCMAHGSSERTRPGERRIAIVRYGPKWGAATGTGISLHPNCWRG